MKGSGFGSDRKPSGDRWNRDSEAGKLLKQLLENGDIDPTDPPKLVYDSYPIFQQYDLSKFRAALNKMKAEMGCNVRVRKGDGDDDNGVSGTIGYVGGNPGNVNGGGGYASSREPEEVEEKQCWKPIHTVFEWTDRELRDRITVVVLMPSGINQHDYSLAVVGGGTRLELSVSWPEMMIDSEKLHEPFKKKMEALKLGLTGVFQDYLTRVQQFQLHINEMERRMDRLESKCTIELPNQVHAHHIETNAFGRSDTGTRVLYVNLMRECSDSNKQKGTDFFII
jgi:hypothetical protein